MVVFLVLAILVYLQFRTWKNFDWAQLLEYKLNWRHIAHGIALIYLAYFLRETPTDIPVIVISAMNDLQSVVKGIKGGAEDYLPKPFDFAELLARVQALLRRASGTPEPVHLEFEDLSMNLLSREVFRGGRKIELQPREFSLLEYLMRNKGRVVTRAEILENVWGYNYIGDTRTVDTHITRLRTKLGDAGDMIKTVRGFGYKMEAP